MVSRETKSGFLSLELLGMLREHPHQAISLEEKPQKSPKRVGDTQIHNDST